MNYLKIQQEILKELVKDKSPMSLRAVNVSEEKNVVYLIYGTHLYAMWKQMFFLDLKDKIGHTTVVDAILREEENQLSAEKTNEIRQLDSKTQVQIFKTEKCDCIAIDPKLLKNFDKDVMFKGSTDKAPLYVYENGQFAGVILPIILKL